MIGPKTIVGIIISVLILAGSGVGYGWYKEIEKRVEVQSISDSQEKAIEIYSEKWEAAEGEIKVLEHTKQIARDFERHGDEVLNNANLSELAKDENGNINSRIVSGYNKLFDHIEADANSETPGDTKAGSPR